MPDLTDPRTLRVAARRSGLVRSRRLGQHFLVDRGALDTIVAALELSGTEQVVEVGCGAGTLTVELAERAGLVVAVDIDAACVRATRAAVGEQPHVRVVRADARALDPAEFGINSGWVAAGNLPYQLTGRLLSHVLELPVPPARAVFVVQREVAVRLSAAAGDWSLATVAIRSLAEVERVIDIPPAAFDPAPAVHSSLIRLRPAPALDAASRDAVLELARAVFQARRKTLRHGVARALGGDLAAATRVLGAAGVDAGRRPGTLHLDEWRRLADAAARATHAPA